MSISNKTSNIKIIIIIREIRLPNKFSEENILIICFI